MNIFSKIIISFIIIFSNSLNAQCVVDAGEDIHICLDDLGFNTTNLNPSILNASYPIQNIQWSYFYQVPNSNIVENASSFLNDTTILTPYFTFRPYLNDIYINLNVEDSLGNICKDSVRVSYSLFNFFPDDFIAIQQGDTAEIYAIAESGFPPYLHSWSPNYNISDTTSSYVNVWPDQNQQYQATVTDSFDCEYTLPAWSIQVLPTGIIDLTNNKLKIHPNPTNSILNFEFEDDLQNFSIRILDLNGKVVLSNSMKNDFIDISSISNGTYTVQLFDENNELLSYGKIQKY
jgi:hypothetical protein